MRIEDSSERFLLQMLHRPCPMASGYKAESSRSQEDSLFVQAAYQLLRHFLERHFKHNSRAA
jgi:hypothetical protein